MIRALRKENVNAKMKCKCGVKLFDRDMVESDEIVQDHYSDDKYMGEVCIGFNRTYRCPKCYKAKKVKLEGGV